MLTPSSNSRYQSAETLTAGGNTWYPPLFTRPILNVIGEKLHIVSKPEEGRPDLISYSSLGDSALWWVIMEYNNVVDPLALREGDNLRIPLFTLESPPRPVLLSDVVAESMPDNSSTSAVDLHLSEFSDFNLAGSGTQDTVQLGSLSLCNWARQTGTNPALNEMVRAEVGISPGASTAVATGPGDGTFTFYWDKTIPAGSVFEISEDNIISVVVAPPISEVGKPRRRVLVRWRELGGVGGCRQR